MPATPGGLPASHPASPPTSGNSRRRRSPAQRPGMASEHPATGLRAPIAGLAATSSASASRRRHLPKRHHNLGRSGNAPNAAQTRRKCRRRIRSRTRSAGRSGNAHLGHRRWPRHRRPSEKQRRHRDFPCNSNGRDAYSPAACASPERRRSRTKSRTGIRACPASNGAKTLENNGGEAAGECTTPRC